MLTKNYIKAAPHGTGDWPEPKDEQNKTCCVDFMTLLKGYKIFAAVFTR